MPLDTTILPDGAAKFVTSTSSIEEAKETASKAEQASSGKSEAGVDQGSEEAGKKGGMASSGGPQQGSEKASEAVKKGGSK